VPASVEEFLTARDQVATSPEGGAAMFVLALLVFTEDEELGKQCLACAAGSSRLVSGPQGYKGLQLTNGSLARIRDQLSDRKYLAMSYIGGAKPENGYELGSAPYVVECMRNPHSGDPATGRCKVFVASSGADSPRPVTLAMNDKGIWKAIEWSSLLVGVRPPAGDAPQEI
jgi:hypothetical protein